MSNDFQNQKFKALLDKLQQESWQLELLISGFAIYGLFTAMPELKISLNIAKNNDQIFYVVTSFIGIISCSILLFNLLIHVIIRGLWIGALGLRYVSGDIDFEKLNYSNKFTNYLQKKIVSFDKYVGTLENYCSILFAVSFLLIFYIISIALFIFYLFLISYYIISNDYLNMGFRIGLGSTLVVIILISGFFTFLDFITQGYLKKKKRLAKIYYPFYKIFSWISLSFLYRPIVYNFLDHKFTKKISFLLVPAYIVILAFTSFKHKNSNYLDNIKSNSSLYLDNRHYENFLSEKDDFVKIASIQSKVIRTHYLKVFRVFNRNLEDKIYNYHPSLKPEEDKRGFTSGIRFSSSNFMNRRKQDSLAKEYVSAFNSMYSITIDTIALKADFLIAHNKQNQRGFETFLSIKNLKEGKHTLRLKRKYIKDKDTILYTDASIPFWYFK